MIEVKSTTTVKHFANVGDLVASMAALKEYHKKTGKKIIFCQQLNVLGTYYEGAVHPVTDQQGRQVMMNEGIWSMIRPLLLSQKYIEDAQVFNGQKVDIDLDIIRGKIFVNMPQQALQQWLFIAYSDLAADLSKAWIDIDPEKIDLSDCKLMMPGFSATGHSLPSLNEKVIVNFTERYRNHGIHYYFLKEYKDYLIFSGTENEYRLFCSKWELDIPYLKVGNFLQLASIIKQCRFILACQSFIWNTAEALKTPRIVELCQYAPNCQPFIGENSFGFYHQTGCEYYFKYLFEKLNYANEQA